MLFCGFVLGVVLFENIFIMDFKVFDIFSGILLMLMLLFILIFGLLVVLDLLLCLGMFWKCDFWNVLVVMFVNMFVMSVGSLLMLIGMDVNGGCGVGFFYFFLDLWGFLEFEFCLWK